MKWDIRLSHKSHHLDLHGEYADLHNMTVVSIANTHTLTGTVNPSLVLQDPSVEQFFMLKFLIVEIMFMFHCASRCISHCVCTG